MLINHWWIYVNDEAFGCFRRQSCHQPANAVKGQRLTTVLLSKLSTAFNSCQTCLKLVRAVESFQELSKLLTACNRFVNIVRFNLIFSNSIHFLSIAEPNQGEVWQIFHHSQSLQREECLYDVKEVVRLGERLIWLMKSTMGLKSMDSGYIRGGIVTG